MKRLLLAALIGCCGVASAETVLLGKNLIGKGASAVQARDAAGEPTQLDSIPGDESSPAMEIWTYRLDDKTITLWLVGDKVVKALEERKPATAASATAPVAAQLRNPG
ncbi:hypothetical protein DFR29_106144 [Tahibacter aquaticus]|uniref:Uncharacterized protein n=1 Tax=Tahibacter aquaticus TaxID=520092 RepID=A0A4R6YYB1_9GAMM|nr:hypothetical protein [Tahibacter aquaticus]TDR43999.1 hypothetical protein DFR29_106144 [Tahibacter aquaticus]